MSFTLIYQAFILFICFIGLVFGIKNLIKIAKNPRNKSLKDKRRERRKNPRQTMEILEVEAHNLVVLGYRDANGDGINPKKHERSDGAGVVVARRRPLPDLPALVR